MKKAKEMPIQVKRKTEEKTIAVMTQTLFRLFSICCKMRLIPMLYITCNGGIHT